MQRLSKMSMPPRSWRIVQTGDVMRKAPHPTQSGLHKRPHAQSLMQLVHMPMQLILVAAYRVPRL